MPQKAKPIFSEMKAYVQCKNYSGQMEILAINLREGKRYKAQPFCFSLSTVMWIRLEATTPYMPMVPSEESVLQQNAI